MHEAALCAMKQSLTASFRHFFAKKMAERITSEPTVSETRFSPQKSQNLASEMSLKIASLGRILTQNGSPPVRNNISPFLFKIQVTALEK